MYEYKPIPDAFEKALKNFQEGLHKSLIDKKILPGTQEYQDDFKRHTESWIERNTRVQIKSSYYDTKSRLISRLKALMSKLPSAKENEELFVESYKTILDATYGYKDDDGQPMGTEIPDGRKKRVYDAQKAIIKAQEKWAGTTGLTKIEMARLRQLSQLKKKNNGRLSSNDHIEYVGYLKKMEKLGLTEEEREELNNILQELNELQEKEPTLYYLDNLNYWLEKIDTDDIYKTTGIKEFDASNVDLLYDEELLDKLFAASPEFEKWFNQNHITTQKERIVGGELVSEKKYQRLYVWTVSKPSDPIHYETSSYTDMNGESHTITRVPKLKFYNRAVKKEYWTGYDPQTDQVKPTIGVHIDNQSNREDAWLPKVIEGSPYINEEYFRLKNADPDSQDGKLFKLLEVVKRQHIENQAMLPKTDRLYYDVPRYSMSNKEKFERSTVRQLSEEKVGFFRKLFDRLLNWLKSKNTETFSWKTENQLVRADAYGDIIDNIPIQGISNLSVNDTSLDIFTSNMRYMYAAEHKKQLLRMDPTAKAIKKILDDPNRQLKEMDKINYKNFVNHGLTTYLNKRGKYVRRDAFNNMYERDFTKKMITGFGEDNEWLYAIQNTLFGAASFSFFAFNIPSALKNQMGAKFQALIEASAGENITLGSLAKGEMWSTGFMFEGSTSQIYAKGTKNLKHQMYDIFDPSQGRFEEKIGSNLTRSLSSDVMSLTWPDSFRKWTALQAEAQTFAGMMYKKKVKMGDQDIDYMEAWELNDKNQIALKKGIDVRFGNVAIDYRITGKETVEELSSMFNIPLESMKKIMDNWRMSERLERVKKINEERNEKLKGKESDVYQTSMINKKYDIMIDKQLNVKIDNTEFKKFRSRIHSVMNKLNGAYSKYDQPEMQRYLLFRMFSYLRRYFTTMFVNRFGIKRRNPGYGGVDEGYYISFLKGFKNIIMTKSIHGMTPKQKAAFMRVVTEIGGLVMMSAIVGMMGFDDDDEDRFEKLRDKTGALPGFGVADDPSRQFDFGNWVGLHFMNLIMQVRAENEQFVPMFGFGLESLTSMTDLKAIALGPTLDKYKSIVGSIWDRVTGDDRAFYKRTAGPYEWQQQDSWKLWNYFFKMFGISGTMIDPAFAIQSYKSIEGRAKF
jgi:hypothetical protein